MKRMRFYGIWLTVITLVIGWAGQVGVQQTAADPLPTTLLAEGEKHQVIQFNPAAALQQRIFADGFVPNSPEFEVQMNGVSYTAQRAENLDTGAVRVYYAAVGDWGNVLFVAQDEGGVSPAGFEPDPVFTQTLHDYSGGFMGIERHNFLGTATGPAHQTKVAIQAFGRYGNGSCSYPNAIFLWREDTRQIYFLPQGPGLGLHAEGCRDFWQVFPDTWQAGDPNNDDLAAPSGKVIPRRGIGKVWRENFYNKSPFTLELPGEAEQYTTATVQPFENGTAFFFPDSRDVYVLFDHFQYITRGGENTGKVWFQQEGN